MKIKKVKTTITELRKGLKVFRKHWVDAFIILKFKSSLALEDNLKEFEDWVYNINFKQVKNGLYLNGFSVDYNLKIKKNGEGGIK